MTNFLLTFTFMLTFILYTMAIAGLTYLFIAMSTLKKARSKKEQLQDRYYELTPEMAQQLFASYPQPTKKPGETPKASEPMPPHSGMYL